MIALIVVSFQYSDTGIDGACKVILDTMCTVVILF
jgi:hypothetical protein